MANFRYNPDRLDDYVIFCQICGKPCWYSESTILPPETGKGGYIVCPEDIDQISYDLIPWIVRPEEPIPYAAPSAIWTTTDITNHGDLIPDGQDPMSTPPSYKITPRHTWNTANIWPWDKWHTNWNKS